ncbi:glycosyltransferase [Candidatus Woesearchaeota archaeon]|nr:glycosyltransferase [Candidatus Woesearchaeota archaeon]
MKILMLNYEFPPVGGGAANANYNLLKEFAKDKDIEIDLITSSQDKFNFEAFSENIRVFKLDVKKENKHYWKMAELFRWSLKAYILSKKLIKNKRYNLCHCWFGWPSGLIGYKLRKKMPYIVALRGSDVPGYNTRLRSLDNILFRPLSKKIWGSAENVIANSDGLKRLASKTSNCKINVIYNGIDVQEFNPGYRTKKELRILSTSRLIRRKGIKYLIGAICDLKDVRLDIFGDGNLRTELESLVSGRGIKNKVVFHGNIHHPELKRYYQEADVFVLPSLNEGMSNSLLEAMASGLAVITTDTGGTKELIKDNGFVVKKESSKAISEKLRLFESKRDLVISMGKQSRKIAENMSWKKTAERYWRIYDELA